MVSGTTNSDGKKDSPEKKLSLSDDQRAQVRRVLKWAVMLTTLLLNVDAIASLP